VQEQITQSFMAETLEHRINCSISCDSCNAWLARALKSLAVPGGCVGSSRRDWVQQALPDTARR
jgi:hypothetical protein